MEAHLEELSKEMQATLASLGSPVEAAKDDVPDNELSINLPQLIERMQQMVVLMEKNTDMYEGIKSRLSFLAPHEESVDGRSSLWLNDSSRDSVYTGNRSSLMGLHDSFGSSRGSERQSELVHASSAPSRMSLFTPSNGLSFETPEEEPRQSFAFSQAYKKPTTQIAGRQRKTYQKPAPVTVDSLPTVGRQRLAVATPSASSYLSTRSEYTVRWTQGDLGISLNNFSSDHRGLQISSLERTSNGFAAGIGNARLGDILVSINREVVENLPFNEIKDVLKKTRRPMVLVFRSNPSSVTSPSSAKRYVNNQRSFEEDAPVSLGTTHLKEQPSLSNVSTESSESALSENAVEDLEEWLRRQDAMHSDLVLLLTETIQRCESLKEENFDQLQLMMQRTIKRRNSTLLRQDSHDF